MAIHGPFDGGGGGFVGGRNSVYENIVEDHDGDADEGSGVGQPEDAGVRQVAAWPKPAPMAWTATKTLVKRIYLIFLGCHHDVISWEGLEVPSEFFRVRRASPGGRGRRKHSARPLVSFRKRTLSEYSSISQYCARLE